MIEPQARDDKADDAQADPTPPPRPTPLAVDADAIPQYLRAMPHWLVWRYKWKSLKGKAAGKWDKPPLCASDGRPASSTDPATWSTFAVALAAYKAGGYDGVGFVVHKHDGMTAGGELVPLTHKDGEHKGEPINCPCGQPDDLVVLDLDKCRDKTTDQLETWALEIVAEVNSYAEASPSAGGVRGIARGRKPPGRCRKGGFEIYETGRYVTITGQRFPDAPPAVEERQGAIGRLCARMFAPDPPKVKKRTAEAGAGSSGPASGAPCELTDEEIVALAERAKNAAKFRALMAGDISGHDDDPSRADGALCCTIAFYTKDAAQIERIFGRSRLADRDKWRDRADYRRRTIDRALELVTEQYQPHRRRASVNGKHTSNGHAAAGEAGEGATPQGQDAPDDSPLGPLTLRPGSARRTAGGAVKVQVQALMDGVIVYDFVLSASPQAWRQHAAMLDLQVEGGIDRAALLKTFAAIVAAAGRRADAPPDSDAPTVETIVKALAPPRWAFTARTPKGAAISEARGHEVNRAEFVACVDDELMAAGAEASDSPKDFGGRVSRPDLLRVIQAELQVLWATLMRTLPPLADADLSAGSAAGKAFREAMARLWTATRTFEVAKTMAGTAGESVASRASLISRVRTQAKDYLEGKVTPQPREKWRPVQHAFDGWWRPYVVPGDGNISVLLAMRWSVTGQIGVELPGVTDQASLTHLGGRFGCLDPKPPVPGVLSGGSTRLAVLSLSMTEELLEMPQDEDQENSDADPVTPEECN